MLIFYNIILGEASLSNVKVIKCLIRSFELVSEIKVNFHKSNFGAVRVDVKDVERFADLLNCRTLNLPFVYLGIPIGANPTREQTWRSVIDKFQMKLASWKHKALSLARRACLINLVLTSLPLFSCLFFKKKIVQRVS